LGEKHHFEEFFCVENSFRGIIQRLPKAFKVIQNRFEVEAAKLIEHGAKNGIPITMLLFKFRDCGMQAFKVKLLGFLVHFFNFLAFHFYSTQSALESSFEGIDLQPSLVFHFCFLKGELGLWIRNRYFRYSKKQKFVIHYIIGKKVFEVDFIEVFGLFFDNDCLVLFFPFLRPI